MIVTSSYLTKRCLKTISKGLVISSQALLLSACLAAASGTSLSKGSGGGPSKKAEGLAAPTKDDVALVNGVRFSISGYQQVKSQMNKPSQEAIFWVGVAAILFQEDAKNQSVTLTLAQTTNLARYSWGDHVETPADPAVVQYLKAVGSISPRSLADRLVARSIVQRNPQVLAELQ